MAREHLKGKVSLAGYVPTKVLLNGAPEDVHRVSLECLDNGVDVLAPGCSLLPHVTFDNIAAMTQAAHDWSQSSGT